MQRLARLGLIGLLLASACGTQRSVVVDGREVPSDAAAESAYREARAAFDAGRNDEAARLFARFLTVSPDDPQADLARLNRGQALERAGKLREAQAAFEEIVEKHPMSKMKNAAALELLRVRGMRGKKQDPAEQRRLVGQLSDAEKHEVGEAPDQTRVASGRAGEAARAAARSLEGARAGADRDTQLAAYLAALDQASGLDVAKLVSELDRNSPAWPAAALKLARLQLHAGDRGHALELAGEIVQRVPGGPVADGARALQLSASTGSLVKPRLVGLLLPLTDPGFLRVFSEGARDAVALVIDAQKRGSIELEIRDTKNDPDAAAAAVDELARLGAVAIIGPLGAAEGPAAAVRAQQLGIPLVSLSATEGIPALGDFVFRIMTPRSAEVRAVAQYAQTRLGAKTFGVLQPESSSGDEQVRFFWDAVEAGGGEIRGFEHYPQKTTTFKPYIARLVGRTREDMSERKEFSAEQEKIAAEISDPYRRRKALSQLLSQTAPIVDFDALFIPDGARTVRLIAPAVAAEDVITGGCDEREVSVIRKTTKKDDLRTVQLLGISLWDSPDLIDEKVGAAKYVQCAIFVDSFFPDSERAATRKFVDDYTSAYNRQPTWVDAHAHDAAALVRRIIEERKPQTREAFRDALAAMPKPFAGATGNIVFGKDREAQKSLFWLWVNRGTIKEFDPEGKPPVPPVAPPAGASAAGSTGL